ncbi:MAG: phosphate regulon transcriptional regulator PhoB [Alphaproteobacteria bacterium]
MAQDDPDKPLVLVVDDEAALVTLLRYTLEREGFRVLVAGDGGEAISVVADQAPDVVVLDWMLPVMSGLEVCRQLRARPITRDVPVLMLTARAEESDKVRGLDTGADDFMTKPVSMRELVARLRALLRRAQPAPPQSRLVCRDVVMDLDGRRVTRGGRPVHLGPTEFRLLRHLLRHPGRVFSREDLLNAVWGRDIYVEPRTVDVHVRRLRKALNGDDAPDIIRTVRAAGYAIDPADGMG